MDYNKEKKQFKFYFIVFGLLISFSMGMLVGKITDNTSLGAFGEISRGQEYSIQDSDFLDKIWGILNEKYVGDIPGEKEALEGAAKGLVNSLEDPYTVYWNEKESADFLGELEGSFEGIGAEVGIRDDIVTIISPLDDMPAQKAGIKPGDKVLKIGDELTSEMSLDEAVSKIRGPKGSTVKLTIFRNYEEQSEPFEVEITRNVIDIKSIKWEKLESGEAYLRVSGFLKDTDAEFASAVQEIKASGLNKIILDLRNNPGGFLETAIDLTGYFVSKGSVVVIEDYGNNGDNKIHKTTRKPFFDNINLVVLVNEGTASSAEILAGALRDNLGVKLVGAKTFGKGSVQELEELDDGSYMKITVAKWLTPSGLNIDGKGLDPDVEEKIDENQKTEEGVVKDSQLEKAKEVLR